MRVIMYKTKVMISGEWQKVTQKAVRWPCGVCGRSIGNNSIQCTSWRYVALVVVLWCPALSSSASVTSLR